MLTTSTVAGRRGIAMSDQHRGRLVSVAIVVAIAALVAVAAVRYQQRTHAGLGRTGFWSLMTVESPASGAPLFSSLADLEPGSRTAAPKWISTTQAVVLGHVVGVEPGIAYASGGDALQAPVIPYDSPDAAIRWVVVDVQVDSVLRGAVHGSPSSSTVRIEMVQPAGVTLSDLSASLSSAGQGIYFLANAYDLDKLRGVQSSPTVDAAFDASVQRVIGQGVFVRGPTNGISAPFLDDSLEQQLLGKTVGFDDLVSRIRTSSG
jgi:hypothetical protein